MMLLGWFEEVGLEHALDVVALERRGEVVVRAGLDGGRTACSTSLMTVAMTTPTSGRRSLMRWSRSPLMPGIWMSSRCSTLGWRAR